MHIYIGLRGIIEAYDRFLKELSSQYLPYKKQVRVTNEFGQVAYQWVTNYSLQISVRRMMGEIYEIVFPEEHLDLMLMTLFGKPGAVRDGSGLPQHKRHQKYIWGLRKALGIEPLPETWKVDRELIFYKANLEIIGIGVKYDYWVKDGLPVPRGTEGAWEAI